MSSTRRTLQHLKLANKLPGEAVAAAEAAAEAVAVADAAGEPAAGVAAAAVAVGPGELADAARRKHFRLR
jgi:hypothetical protein